LLPTTTGFGSADFWSARSAVARICTVTLDELFPGLGSVSFAVTVAVLTEEPAAAGWTWIDTVADAPLASVPSAQLIVVEPVQDPWLGVGGAKSCTPAGSASLRVTPVACEGPLFVTVTVYVKAPAPRCVVANEAVFVTATSAPVAAPTASTTELAL